MRIAREKARAHAVQADTDDVVLCADTTVALGRRILGKPEWRGSGAEFLYALSGRRHRVVSPPLRCRGDRVWQRDVVPGEGQMKSVVG